MTDPRQNPIPGQTNPLPGNSMKAREESERPKVTQVTSAPGKERKKPLHKRIAETFTGDDAKTVGDYLLFDVVVPATKDLISNMVSQGIERLLFGNSTPSSRSRGSGPTYSYNRPNYRSMYPGRNFETDGGRGSSSPNTGARTGRGLDFKEVILETRGDAEEALDQLKAYLDRYNSVSVAELYELVGLQPEYTFRRWGWRNLRESRVVRLDRDAYLIELPPAEVLD